MATAALMPAAIERKKSHPPVALRPKPETMVKIRKIAKVNGLSVADVMNLCLASGLNMVEAKLAEIHQPAKAA